jgi:FAD binding domain
MRATTLSKKAFADRWMSSTVSSLSFNRCSRYGSEVVTNPPGLAVPSRHLSSSSTYCLKNSNNRNARKNERLLVVGSGVAGCATALVAAETYRIPVTILFAGNVPQDCNSNWAQGGIIYRNYDPRSGDSAESLARDIHRAGAGLCDDAAVRKVSEEGPKRVRQLLLKGGPFADTPFDKKPNGELSLCLGKSGVWCKWKSKDLHPRKLIVVELMFPFPKFGINYSNNPLSVPE